jgi:phosphohistidine swiveling domain-containing protein
MTQDILNSAIFHLPAAMERARPVIDQFKSNALRDADLFVQRQMENRIRPEIESQSAVILSEIDRTANAALLTAALIGVSVVGGIGLVAWYYKGRR